MTNSLEDQTLVISVQVDSQKSFPVPGPRDGECYVEVTVYRPDQTVYGTWQVTGAIDISIPNAEAGEWRVETENHCSEAVNYQVEAKGGGTGMVVGRVFDAYTGLGVEGAGVACETGGAAVTLESGYFTGVAVAGTGAVSTTAADYLMNVQADVTVITGEVTSLDIPVIPDAQAPQGSPRGGTRW